MNGEYSNTTFEGNDDRASFDSIGKTLRQFGLEDDPIPPRRPSPLLIGLMLVLMFLAGIAFGMSL